MIADDKIIEVTNRDNGSVGYIIPDLGNLRRNFESGETKKITMGELRKLAWLPNNGGQVLLRDYLLIHDKEAIEELLNQVEPEYYYTEEDVKKLLLEGSLDQVKDCLDFAPQGTIDLLKKLAVDLEINDIAKREAILKSTGFNVTSAILINRETSEDNDEEKGKTRRASAITEEKKDNTTTTPERRTQPQRYNVVSMKK